MNKYRLGNKKISYKEKIKTINMKELDEKIHGSSESKVLLRTMQITNNKIDNLINIFERSRIMDYMILTDSKRRMFIINFISGIGRGFGQAIGFSVLTGFFLYIVSKWVNIPIIGAYIAEFLDMVDNFRGR